MTILSLAGRPMTVPAQVRYTREKGRMRRRLLTTGWTLWMVGACLCLLPRLAAAVDLSPTTGQLFLFHACSTSDATPILHSRAPLPLVNATDLDGDTVPSALPQKSSYAPNNDGARFLARQNAPACHGSPAVLPFAPRPPPSSLPL